MSRETREKQTMGSITLTAVADDEVIGKAREYAEKHNTSLNALASDWLQKLAVKPPRGDFDDILDLMDKAANESCLTPELLSALDAAKGDSNGWKWNREEIYNERIR